MLINDFYNCLDIEAKESEYGCRVVFNADHDIFKGHFPGQPLVPGVCMMEMMKELLQTQLNTPLVLSTARNVKFLGFITPELQPTVKITWKATENGYSINASLSSASNALFKLDGVYVPFAVASL
jgi:3-hydroxyacyl-[acyl-carrier-protein] dehydratase